MSPIEKNLRDGLAAKRDGNIKFPVLLQTPYGDVTLLQALIQGSSKAIIWASRTWGKAAA